MQVMPLPPRRVPKNQRTRAADPFAEHALELCVEARELGLSGATDFEAAEHFGIHVSTLNKWKIRHPEFAAALRLGKDIADGMVEASLYHKARGYTYRSEKIFQHDGQIIRAETVEHVPPDTTSMIFWLKNRQKERWRDQQELKVDGAIATDQDPRALAIAMLATLRAAMETPPAAPMIEGETSDAADA